MKTKMCSGEQAQELIEGLRFPRHIQGVSQDIWQLKDYSETIKKSDTFTSLHAAAGETIVREGEIVSSQLRADPSFAYASVPLGVILSGEVIVLQDGRGVRRLVAGDFVGLFETSFYISVQGNRAIGTWTLVADTNTSILFFGKQTLDRQSASADVFRSALLELARTDTIPKPITDLPLLDRIANTMTPGLLKDTLVIMHTHLLPSNVALVRHIAQLVSPEHLFVLEKPYSTMRSVYTQVARMGVSITPVNTEGNMPYEFALQRALMTLWEHVLMTANRSHIKNIVIIDDGGSVLLSVPWQRIGHISVSGVEQTRRGIRLLERTTTQFPPTVNVASSSVKITIEPAFIASAVVRKMASLGLFDPTPRVGIVGAGAIGSAIKNLLAKQGIRSTQYDVKVHDQRTPPEFGALTTMDSVLESSDIIIGCTGYDIMHGVALERISGHKILVSASSRDVEFASLLNTFSFSEKSFATASIAFYPGLTMDILNGGYPINFDREQEWESAEDMQVTRSLMYAGFMQATKLPSERHTIHELDKEIQKEIVSLWQEEKRILKNGPPKKRKTIPKTKKKTKKK